MIPLRHRLLQARIADAVLEGREGRQDEAEPPAAEGEAFDHEVDGFLCGVGLLLRLDDEDDRDQRGGDRGGNRW